MGITREGNRDALARVRLYVVWPFAFICSILGFLLLLVEAFFFALIRGPRCVGWVRPSRCPDFNSWVSAEWHYYGRGGMQIGSRRFGLEVARKGYRSPRHPLL